MITPSPAFTRTIGQFIGPQVFETVVQRGRREFGERHDLAQLDGRCGSAAQKLQHTSIARAELELAGAIAVGTIYRRCFSFH